MCCLVCHLFVMAVSRPRPRPRRLMLWPTSDDPSLWPAQFSSVIAIGETISEQRGINSMLKVRWEMSNVFVSQKSWSVRLLIYYAFNPNKRLRKSHKLKIREAFNRNITTVKLFFVFWIFWLISHILGVISRRKNTYAWNMVKYWEKNKLFFRFTFQKIGGGGQT